jgi:hypothetical protein
MVKKPNNGLEELRTCGPYNATKIMFLLSTQNPGDSVTSLPNLTLFLQSDELCVISGRPLLTHTEAEVIKILSLGRTTIILTGAKDSLSSCLTQ